MPSKRYDYGVPKELSRSIARIYTLAIEGDQFLIEFFDKENRMVKVKSHISGKKEYDLNNLKDAVSSKLSYYFDDAISAELTNKLLDITDKVYDNHATYVIENIRRKHKADEAKFGPLEGEDSHKKQGEQKPVFVVKKFTGPTTVSPNGAALAEAVLINGKPQFAVTINGGLSVNFFNELETSDMIVQPPTKQEYPPNSALEYESEDEFMEYIQYAIEKDSLYKLLISVREFYTKEYFVDTDPKNSTMLALFTITSYFQDKFSTVPYIWLIGDNGSGKNSILLTYSRLGYRVFYMTGASGANICEYLGTVEDGQGTIAEDELGDLDRDEYKRLLYMTGYAFGGSVPKILDASSKSRDQRFYRSYCQKISASENLPSIKYSKGVLDREFIIKCVKGFPKYNAKMINKKTKTPEVLELQMRLEIVRKRLFAYRLVHFGDVVPEIEGLNISGRALELTESALLLFHKYRSSPEENEIFNKGILPTLSDFLKDRLGRRNLSLEAKLYPIITKMVQEQGETLENDRIFSTVQ